MRIIIILSLILSCTILNAQDRNDTIRMKDGTEILCQILKVSEPDSIIQFCIRDNGELKVKKVQSAFVASYSWPGKDQAGKYRKMLGVKTIQDGEIYKGYWYVKLALPKHELTSSELAATELKKAHTILKIGFAVSTAGIITAVFGPRFLHEPTIQGSNMYSYPEDFKAYENTVKALHLVGGGIIVAGTIIGISSITHFKTANLLKQESGKGLSITIINDGLGLALKF